MKLNFKMLTKFSPCTFEMQLGLCPPLALPETLSHLNTLPIGIVWQNEYTLYYFNHLLRTPLVKQKKGTTAFFCKGPELQSLETWHFNMQKVFSPGVCLRAAYNKVCCIF